MECIYGRRSVRRFTGEPVGTEQLRELMRAGSWAPSGLNNQPWRFVPIIAGGAGGPGGAEVRMGLAGLTKYGKVIESAQALIAVFIDTGVMYHEAKDHMAIGACMQNMLLAAHAMGLGAVWLGEILKSAPEVSALLGVPGHCELMAVLALGHPAEGVRESSRKDIDELILKEFY